MTNKFSDTVAYINTINANQTQNREVKKKPGERDKGGKHGKKRRVG
jgi:hypothetical protein